MRRGRLSKLIVEAVDSVKNDCVYKLGGASASTPGQCISPSNSIDYRFIAGRLNSPGRHGMPIA
jgi:hypothetical protein